jgi:O-acetylhomoserine/O-acetylserine sulfhydrylase-like pyridoxal-dependent enzyme
MKLRKWKTLLFQQTNKLANFLTIHQESKYIKYKELTSYRQAAWKSKLIASI